MLVSLMYYLFSIQNVFINASKINGVRNQHRLFLRIEIILFKMYVEIVLSILDANIFFS